MGQIIIAQPNKSLNTLITLEQGGGLEVKDNGDRTGSITAIGTADKPIVFTGTNKRPGAWRHIYINSGDLNNKLHNVIIEYAGGTDGKPPALSVISRAKAENTKHNHS